MRLVPGKNKRGAWLLICVAIATAAGYVLHLIGEVA
jgi:hypothetical protein